MAILRPEETEPAASALNEDEIIRNFATLIRRSERAKTNKNLMSVIAKLEENIRDNEKYLLKMFLVNTKTGTMINADGAPNISFRVDTVTDIFNSISGSLQEKGLNAEEVFFRAGMSAGKDFGVHILPYFENDLGLSEEEERISEWCTFDSSVGWGKLSYDPQAGTISILNNFETKRNAQTGAMPVDCGFFKGYIAGVLSEITGCRNVGVKCAGECPKTADGEKLCVLKIERN